MLLDILIFLVSLAIIAFKYLDCITISSQIASLSQERNPFARFLMKKLGIGAVIWGVFVLSIIIVGLALWLVFTLYNYLVYKIFYITIGSVVTIAQFSVAHSNKSGKLDFITRILSRVYKGN